MFKQRFGIFILFILVLTGVGSVVWWLSYDPVSEFTHSVPGSDKRGEAMLKGKDTVEIGERFTFYKSSVGMPGYNWPRFRGADFDNIVKGSTKLIEKWGNVNERILWKVALGEGHAAPAIYDGRVYLLDYDEKEREDALRCFDLETGGELWRRAYHVRLKRNHGLSRTIPAVTAKYVVTIGPKCQVMCCDRITGDLIWGLDLARDYEVEVPFWYTGQCPLVENDTVILAVGGRSLMIAVDCRTGQKVWETPNPRKWKMSHSSVMPMNDNGKKIYVYAAIGGLCGIAADGPDRGKVVWETNEFAPSVVAPSPVIMNDGYIFMTAGYGAGSALLKAETGKRSVRLVRQYQPSEGLAAEQQTPIYLNGYLYGIQPKDAGGLRNQFVVASALNPQEIVTSSGKEERFGLGPYIVADEKFFILNDDGEMTIAKISPAGFKSLDKARIIDGHDSWGPLVITGGYLLMRDSKTLLCLDIKAK